MFAFVLTSALGSSFDFENPIARFDEELDRRRYFWPYARGDSDDSSDSDDETITVADISDEFSDEPPSSAETQEETQDEILEEVAENTTEESLTNAINAVTPNQVQQKLCDQATQDQKNEEIGEIVATEMIEEAAEKEAERHAARKVQEWEAREARMGRSVEEKEKEARFWSLLVDGATKLFNNAQSSGAFDHIKDAVNGIMTGSKSGSSGRRRYNWGSARSAESSDDDTDSVEKQPTKKDDILAEVAESSSAADVQDKIKNVSEEQVCKAIASHATTEQKNEVTAEIATKEIIEETGEKLAEEHADRMVQEWEAREARMGRSVAEQEREARWFMELFNKGKELFNNAKKSGAFDSIKNAVNGIMTGKKAREALRDLRFEARSMRAERGAQRNFSSRSERIERLLRAERAIEEFEARFGDAPEEFNS